ncbi:MAG: glycosyltransferase family 39 protein [Clostridia bacterium]|nr:glycosyltransferase family 39 protein [Clostridia bacterium]
MTYKLTKTVYGIMMSLILFLVIFFQYRDYACKKPFLLSNPVILLILFGLFCLCAVAYWLAAGRQWQMPTRFQKPDLDRWIGIFTVILFMGQAYVFHNIFFLSGWDSGMIRDAANLLYLEDGPGFAEYCGDYFSRYPNNIAIINLCAFILKINSQIGIFYGDRVIMSCVLVNCAINSLTCYLIYKTVGLFAGKKTAFAGYCLAVLLIGVSPWSVIFYSDSVGLIFPILSFYLYAKPISRKGWRYAARAGAALVATAGYFIKPQCIILLIAILGVEFLRALHRFRIKNLIRPLAFVLVFAIGFAGVTAFNNLTMKKIGFEPDEERTFGMTHFFMMGLNQKDGGIYSFDDVYFSDSFETAAERKQANIEKAVERLSDMGFFGYAKHVAHKMLIAFNDGTFAWSNEGGFFARVPQGPESRAASFLKSLYYKSGSRYELFCLFAQVIWVAVLIGAFASCLFKHPKPSERSLSILWLSAVGIILFMALFEVRARYVYIFAPIFCVLASVGYRKLFFLAKSGIDRRLAKRGK